jgi:hypothetical protein
MRPFTAASILARDILISGGGVISGELGDPVRLRARLVVGVEGTVGVAETVGVVEGVSEGDFPADMRSFGSC